MRDPVITLTIVFAATAVVSIVVGFWCALRAGDPAAVEARALAAGATPAEARAAGELAGRCDRWKERVGATALGMTLVTIMTPAVLGALIPTA